MLVNWKVEYTNNIPTDKQPPDYYIFDKPYWFFRYFEKDNKVDVVDIHSFSVLERLEKEKLHFYIWQTLKILPKLKNYDLVLSHGMQSAVLLCLFRKIFCMKKPPLVVFDIGSFNSAKESGWILKFIQFVSKSINGVIYHTSRQKEYYALFYPWIVNKSKFIPFGTDSKFFSRGNFSDHEKVKSYILCVGYDKRDWDTLLRAYNKLKTEVKLRLVGKSDIRINNNQIEIVPYIPIDSLISQIEQALFCVIPLENLNYSFGQMTLLQQMALGKAVIAAKVPSMIDYIEDGQTALLYEPKNEDSLIEKLVTLIQNEELRNKLGMNARQAVLSKFNEKQMARQIEDYIFHNFYFENGGAT